MLYKKILFQIKPLLKRAVLFTINNLKNEKKTYKGGKKTVLALL